MDPLTWALDVVLLLHLVGFAALLGGALVQLRDREPLVNAAMVHGALTQLVTGVALVVLDEVADVGLDPVQIGVKLLVSLFVTLLVVVNRRYVSVPRGLWALITLLTSVTPRSPSSGESGGRHRPPQHRGCSARPPVIPRSRGRPRPAPGPARPGC